MTNDTSSDGMRDDNGYVVETFGLTKRFGERVAVDGVDLHIPRGVAFGYLGPNGAGKTTLIRMLLGLTRATAGTMRILGREVPAERAEALARVGAIVEEPHFHGYLTGRENLGIAAAAREREAHGRIEAALERSGLADRGDEKVSKYSLGMRQRLGEVEKICDLVAIVDHGRVVAQGAIEDIAAVREKRIVLGTTDDARAAEVARGHPAVGSVASADDGLHVTLRPDMEAHATAGDINRLLVEAGITVYRLEPARASLEERFLEITSRLGESV